MKVLKKLMARRKKRVRQNGYGEHSYGSTVPSRELFRQRGYQSRRELFRQRGYQTLFKQRGYNPSRLIQYPKQQGRGIGSLFRSFIRIAKPLVKKSLIHAKPLATRAAKSLAKEVAKTGKDIITDSLAENKNLKESFKHRSKELRNRVGKKTLEHLLEKL